MITKPDKKELSSFFAAYINEAPDVNILEYLEKQTDEFVGLFAELSEEDSLFAYAVNKWSIKEIIGHITDTELIFSVRALRIARQDNISLMQFDEKKFVANANFNSQPLDNLLEQFRSVRLTGLLLFDSFSTAVLDRKGDIDGDIISVKTVPYIIAGHAKHHIEVIKTRYLNAL